MSKYIAFVLIIALRLVYHPLHDQPVRGAFNNIITPQDPAGPATLISFQGSVNNNKIILSWAVSENETADLFEIEKSHDGRNFSVTALVFGTDKPSTVSYQFYEKAGNQPAMYRIKLINKDKRTEYSSVIEINPKA